MITSLKVEEKGILYLISLVIIDLYTRYNLLVCTYAQELGTEYAAEVSQTLWAECWDRKKGKYLRQRVGLMDDRMK